MPRHVLGRRIFAIKIAPSVLWRCWLSGRNSIWPVKNMEDDGGGHCLVWMEWRPAGWSVCLPLLIFPCTIKSRSCLLAQAHPGGPRRRAAKRLWWCGVGIWTPSNTWFLGPPESISQMPSWSVQLLLQSALRCGLIIRRMQLKTIHIETTAPLQQCWYCTDDDDEVLTLILETLYIPPILDTTTHPFQSCPRQSRTLVPSFLYNRKLHTFSITVSVHYGWCNSCFSVLAKCPLPSFSIFFRLVLWENLWCHLQRHPSMSYSVSSHTTPSTYFQTYHCYLFNSFSLL